MLIQAPLVWLPAILVWLCWTVSTTRADSVPSLLVLPCPTNDSDVVIPTNSAVVFQDCRYPHTIQNPVTQVPAIAVNVRAQGINSYIKFVNCDVSDVLVIAASRVIGDPFPVISNVTIAVVQCTLFSSISISNSVNYPATDVNITITNATARCDGARGGEPPFATVLNVFVLKVLPRLANRVRIVITDVNATVIADTRAVYGFLLTNSLLNSSVTISNSTLKALWLSISSNSSVDNPFIESGGGNAYSNGVGKLLQMCEVAGTTVKLVGLVVYIEGSSLLRVLAFSDPGDVGQATAFCSKDIPSLWATVFIENVSATILVAGPRDRLFNFTTGRMAYLFVINHAQFCSVRISQTTLNVTIIPPLLSSGGVSQYVMGDDSSGGFIYSSKLHSTHVTIVDAVVRVGIPESGGSPQGILWSYGACGVYVSNLRLSHLRLVRTHVFAEFLGAMCPMQRTVYARYPFVTQAATVSVTAGGIVALSSYDSTMIVTQSSTVTLLLPVETLSQCVSVFTPGSVAGVQTRMQTRLFILQGKVALYTPLSKELAAMMQDKTVRTLMEAFLASLVTQLDTTGVSSVNIIIQHTDDVDSITSFGLANAIQWTQLWLKPNSGVDRFMLPFTISSRGSSIQTQASAVALATTFMRHVRVVVETAEASEASPGESLSLLSTSRYPAVTVVNATCATWCNFTLNGRPGQISSVASVPYLIVFSEVSYIPDGMHQQPEGDYYSAALLQPPFQVTVASGSLHPNPTQAVACVAFSPTLLSNTSSYWCFEQITFGSSAASAVGSPLLLLMNGSQWQQSPWFQFEPDAQTEVHGNVTVRCVVRDADFIPRSDVVATLNTAPLPPNVVQYDEHAFFLFGAQKRCEARVAPTGSFQHETSIFLSTVTKRVGVGVALTYVLPHGGGAFALGSLQLSQRSLRLLQLCSLSSSSNGEQNASPFMSDVMDNPLQISIGGSSIPVDAIYVVGSIVGNVVLAAALTCASVAVTSVLLWFSRSLPSWSDSRCGNAAAMWHTAKAAFEHDGGVVSSYVGPYAAVAQPICAAAVGLLSVVHEQQSAGVACVFAVTGLLGCLVVCGPAFLWARKMVWCWRSDAAFPFYRRAKRRDDATTAVNKRRERGRVGNLVDAAQSLLSLCDALRRHLVSDTAEWAPKPTHSRAARRSTDRAYLLVMESLVPSRRWYVAVEVSLTLAAGLVGGLSWKSVMCSGAGAIQWVWLSIALASVAASVLFRPFLSRADAILGTICAALGALAIALTIADAADSAAAVALTQWVLSLVLSLVTLLSSGTNVLYRFLVQVVKRLAMPHQHNGGAAFFLPSLETLAPRRKRVSMPAPHSEKPTCDAYNDGNTLTKKSCVVNNVALADLIRYICACKRSAAAAEE